MPQGLRIMVDPTGRFFYTLEDAVANQARTENGWQLVTVQPVRSLSELATIVEQSAPRASAFQDPVQPENQLPADDMAVGDDEVRAKLTVLCSIFVYADELPTSAVCHVLLDTRSRPSKMQVTPTSSTASILSSECGVTTSRLSFDSTPPSTWDSVMVRTRCQRCGTGTM